MRVFSTILFLSVILSLYGCSSIESDLQEHVKLSESLLHQLKECDEAISKFNINGLHASKREEFVYQVIATPSSYSDKDDFLILEETIPECAERSSNLWEYEVSEIWVSSISFKRINKAPAIVRSLWDRYRELSREISRRQYNHIDFIDKNKYEVLQMQYITEREKQIAKLEISHLTLQQRMDRSIKKGDLELLMSVLADGYCKKGCSEEILFTIKEGKNKISIISKLLEHTKELTGVDDTYFSVKGKLAYPVSAALSSKQFEIVRVLIESGKSKEVIKANSLYYAIGDVSYSDNETADLLEALFNVGVDTYSTDSPINSAVRHGKLKTLKLLINQGFIFNKDKVLFEYASQYVGPHLPNVQSPWEQEMLDFLLKNGANINAKDREGFNALEARLILTPGPKAVLINQLKAAGIVVNTKKVNVSLRQSYEINRKNCNEKNEKWMRALAKSLRGEKLEYGEDEAIPEYCKKYLN